MKVIWSNIVHTMRNIGHKKMKQDQMDEVIHGKIQIIRSTVLIFISRLLNDASTIDRPIAYNEFPKEAEKGTYC